jgi:hypothetical protein
MNLLEYKIAFIVLMSLLFIVLVCPFICLGIMNKIQNGSCCPENRIADLPENNLPL